MKEGKSRAWIRFFIRNYEGLIFEVFLDPSAKFSFFSGFWFEIELFVDEMDEKENLAHDWKNAPKINLSKIRKIANSSS